MTVLKSSWALSILCAVMATTGSSELLAQRETLNWYFGDKAGVSFATGSPIAVSDGEMRSLEGCAAVSDPNSGELLFYTDGETVWNFNHEVMINGTGLNGDPSTSQSAIIVPWPGKAELYAIINPAPITSVNQNEKCICLMYSIVDMNTENGRGSVIEKNTVLAPDVTEHVSATRDCDDTGWWIVARRRTGSAFISFHLTPDGLNTVPVVSPVTSVQEVRDVGQMHVSPDGTRLVITAPSGVGQLYRFRRTSGKVFSGIDLFTDNSAGSTYGASFSADSRFLFVAATIQQPDPGISVYKFSIDERNDAATVASQELLGFLPDANTFVPMQLGPDRNIYVGRPGKRFLAQIRDPESGAVALIDSAVTLTGECSSGLPNFPGWYLRSTNSSDSLCRLPYAILENETVCEDQCLLLLDESIGLVSQWTWDIPGAIPATSNRKRPLICFPNPGDYPVTLVVGNLYGYDTTTAVIHVLPRPEIQTTGNVATCVGGSVQLGASGADTYEWRPGVYLNDATSANPIATPPSTTVYSVVGRTVDGCLDTSFVIVEVVSLIAGEDISICEGGSGFITAENADEYLWEPAASLDDATAQSPLASPSVTTMYTVTMKLGACVVRDSVLVTVGQSFEVAIAGPDSACVGDLVHLRAIGGGSEFVWSGRDVQPSDSSSTTVLITRSTQVVVRARSGDCVASDSLVIVALDAPTVAVLQPDAICPGETAELHVVGTASTYQWSPTATLSTTTGTMVVANPIETTTYTVEGLNESGCTTTAEVTVIVLDGPQFVAGPRQQVCAGQSVRLQSAGSAETITWTPATGLSDPTVIAPVATPVQTTTYTATAVRDGCVIVDSVTVVVSTIDLQVGADTYVCEGASVELMASGATEYRWTPSTGLSDPDIANPIASPEKTITYEVQARDPIGCEQTKRVTVVVQDTTWISIEGGAVTTEAGLHDVSIPVYIEVEPDALPLNITRVRAAVVHRADVFLPTSVERGRWATSLRGKDRVTYIDLDNLTIVTPRQKVTEILGTIMLGHVDRADLLWEDITWWGIQCPRTHSTVGRLFVTGCALESRGFTTFMNATVQTTAKPSQGVVEVSIGGSEPGVYSIQLVSIEGRVLASASHVRALGDETQHIDHLDMNRVSSGLYFVIVKAPFAQHISRVAWLQ